jgi:competence ComEA-like helix-hairpin-helix protein
MNGEMLLPMSRTKGAADAHPAIEPELELMIRLIIFAVILSSLLLNSVAQSAPAKPDADKLADGPGEKLVEKACISCHNAHVIVIKRASADDWAEDVDKMVARGAVLTDDENDQVVEYLSTHYGPNGSKGEHASPPEPNVPSSSSEKTPAPADSGTTAPMPSSGIVAILNVNKARVQELETSLGLSEKEAEAIVHHREQFGDFKSWQEVSSVPGVPTEKIKDNQKRLVF